MINDFTSHYGLVFREIFFGDSTKILMQHQAEKRSGIVDKTALLPSLRFSHRDQPVHISIRLGSRSSPPETKVHVDMNLSQPRKFTLSPESTAAKLGKKLGMKDIEIGIEAFDNKFIIKGDDEFFVCSLLNPAVQNKLLDIHYLQPHIKLSGNALAMWIYTILSTDQEYDKLIDTTLLIVDSLLDIH